MPLLRGPVVMEGEIVETEPTLANIACKMDRLVVRERRTAMGRVGPEPPETPRNRL